MTLVSDSDSKAMEAEMQADVAAAAGALRRGATLLYPTDTVWGLGCDACNAEAVDALIRLKGRDAGKAMLSLVADADELARLTGNNALPGIYGELCSRFGGRPFTLAVKGVKGLAPQLTAADGTTALRVTSDPWSQLLCRAMGGPVVSTSANFSGNPAPRFFSEIDPGLIDEVGYAALWRRDDTRPSLPSIVARLEDDGQVTILRQ